MATSGGNPGTPSPIGNQQPTGRLVKRVKIKRPVRGAVKRPASGGNMQKTGRYISNVAGYDLFLDHCRKRKIPIQEALLGLGVIEEIGAPCLYVEPAGTPDAVPVTLDENKRRFICSIAPLFDGYPMLQPTARRHVGMFEDVDQDGVPCLVLALGASTVNRVGSNSKPNDQAAAGQQK